MWIVDLLKKSKKIHYICKALKHIGDADYVDFYLEMESNPRLVVFHKNGEKNKEKAIYVIRENGDGWGYFAEFRAMLCKLIYAERMGFTPYIYWSDNFLYYDHDKKENNAYEYFFEQPKGVTADDIEKSYMVAYSKSADAVLIEREYRENDSYGISEEFLNVLGEVCKKSIFFNRETEKRLHEEYSKIVGNGRILGIHFRGTDYRVGYDIHPVFVQIQDEIAAVRKILNQTQVDKIFIATDEIYAINEFQKVFGADKICYYKDTFRGQSDVSVAFSTNDRDAHKYNLGYEVLRDMWTLSLCDCLVAGVSQVSICARVLKNSRNEKYDYIEIIDNGINHSDQKFIYERGK